mgnify:CR=1 FL=1
MAWVIAWFVYGAVLSSPPAHAAPAGPQAVGISPLFIDVRLAPGESRTVPIRLTAGDDSDITAVFKHADFGFKRGSYVVRIIDDSAHDTVSFSTRGWFSTPRSSYEIPANQTIVVPLTIQVPRDVRPGTHLGAALFTAVPAATASGGTSQITAVPRTGPLVFIAIKGGARPKPEISSLNVNHFQTHGPVRPSVTLGNSGAVHYSITGKVTLTGRGRTRTVDVPRQFVMPGRPRTIATGTEAIPQLGSRSLPPGMYVVTATLHVSPDNIRLTDSQIVWIIPWWMRVIMLIALIAFAGATALIWGRLRQRSVVELHAPQPGSEDDDDDVLDEDDLSDGDRDDVLDEDLDDDGSSYFLELEDTGIFGPAPTSDDEDDDEHDPDSGK